MDVKRAGPNSTMGLPPDRPSFVLDRMLGRLAKWLRVMGLDVLYDNTYDAHDLLRISGQTGRLIVTRNTWFESHRDVRSIVLHDNYTVGQMKDLLKRLNIAPDPARFFTRCTVCNAELASVTGEQVKGTVPEYVLHTTTAFSRCPVCGRIYWGGTHKQNMLQTLKAVTG